MVDDQYTTSSLIFPLKWTDFFQMYPSFILTSTGPINSDASGPVFTVGVKPYRTYGSALLNGLLALIDPPKIRQVLQEAATGLSQQGFSPFSFLPRKFGSSFLHLPKRLPKREVFVPQNLSLLCGLPWCCQGLPIKLSSEPFPQSALEGGRLCHNGAWNPPAAH